MRTRSISRKRTLRHTSLQKVRLALCKSYQARDANSHSEILEEIYDEVASGNEIRSVIMHGNRLKEFPIGKIDGTATWKVCLTTVQLLQQLKYIL
jgi:ketol-acid reductoisomerase